MSAAIAATLLQAGLAHHRAGRLSAADGCYRDLLAVAPDHADGLHLLALVCRDRGDVAQAEICLRRVVELTPLDADAWHGLGVALLRGGRAEDAEPCLRTAAALAPRVAAIQGNFGACLHRLGRLREAVPVLRAALALDPTLAPALTCLGLVLATLGDSDTAEIHLRAALRLRPEQAAPYTSLGNLLREQGRLTEAVALLRTALRLQPQPDALHNLAVALTARGELAEAEACCRAALQSDPGHADAHYSLGNALLLGGRLPEGFAGLEWRWRRRGFRAPRQFAQPQWGGGPLAGRTLLLHAEQGLGDAIQMLRFVPVLAQAGGVVLEVPPTLKRLAASLGASVTVVAAGETLPDFDVHCPLPSLPWALDVRLDGIPASVPYLAPPPGAIAAWRHRVAGLPGLRVGLAWAGNPRYAADARRSIAADRLGVLADVPGVAWVSLQPAAAPPPGLALRDWTAELHDLAETAALAANLDLVIAVDTAVAHLAGALGRPVWLLNRHDTCWRWLRERDDSPWYPTLRQFRQARPGDWDGVLAAVRAALQDASRAA